MMIRRIFISIWTTLWLLKLYKEEVNLSNYQNFLHLLRGYLAILDIDSFLEKCNNKVPRELEKEYNETLYNSKLGLMKLNYLGEFNAVIDWKFITYN